ncbi:unnamed protein product [Adineta steineri]|uniref:F-box domain-containing protein n=1 Tax=Adineta steineri TaxID=433720 RepID=A0A819FEX4_9BILA|nr:unnamed protein product [Adineta steineri]CAF3864977.1 unnamed protein product [Adineta steineri]
MMTTTKFIECLPNEIWLLFMSFLSPIDLYRALTGLNHRINDLLFSVTPRPVLDTSQYAGDRICFSDLFQLIEGKDIWSQLLRSSIDTIRLCGTLVSNALCNYNRSPKQFLSNQTFSHLFPSLRRLYITGKAANQIIISQLFVPLSTTLRDVHFTFDAPFNSSSYYEVVNSFTNHQLSFYRMVFDVENDDIKEYSDAKEYEWKQMHLPNTVYLSVYIKRLDDLFNLLDIQSLPVLDHLDVSFIKRGLINDVKMMNVNNITSRLRSLKLSYMSMNDLLTFLSFIHLPLLEQLILIDIHDNTLNRLNDFQKYFQSKKNLPTLRSSSFRFLLRFPGELEDEWNKYYYSQWSLNGVNIDHCLEEQCLCTMKYDYSQTLSIPKKYSLLIFSRSSLPFHRKIHNYSTAMKPKQTPSTSSIEWTCDSFDNSEQIFEVLSKFGTIKKLKFGTWTGTRLQNVATKFVVFSSSSNRLQLDQLRSLVFFTSEKPTTFFVKSQKQLCLRKIFSATTQLVKLTTNWNFIMNMDSNCAREYSSISPLLNLRHLHLRQFRRDDNL